MTPSSGAQYSSRSAVKTCRGQNGEVSPPRVLLALTWALEAMSREKMWSMADLNSRSMATSVFSRRPFWFGGALRSITQLRPTDLKYMSTRLSTVLGCWFWCQNQPGRMETSHSGGTQSSPFGSPSFKYLKPKCLKP